MTELTTRLPASKNVVDRVTYHHLAAGTLVGTYADMIPGVY